MKTLLLTMTLLSSTAAFAISDKGLVEKCATAGLKKLNLQASISGCNVEENDLQVSSLDNRTLNPSKYVWYEAEAQCDQGTIQVSAMVQYDAFRGQCF